MARPIQDSVILFGDSITSRQDVPGSLQAKMGEMYRRTLDILNRGYGGYNTTMAMPLMEQFLARKGESQGSRVRMMTIWFGANDSVLFGAISGQHVPLTTYSSNLDTILATLTSGTTYSVIPNIILITPPPVHVDSLDDLMQSIRTFEHTKTYYQAAKSVGEEWKSRSGDQWKVAVVDAWQAIIDAAGGTGEEMREYFTDGLHLSTKGYEAVWNEITKIVKTDFNGRGVDWEDGTTLKFAVPDWSAVDQTRPESVIEGMASPYRRYHHA